MKRSEARDEALSERWAAALCRWESIAALALLVANDHVLKGSGWAPGWLTGKLSDVAGLIFFPLLLVALARGCAKALGEPMARHSGWLGLISVGATGAVFTAAKVWPSFNAWWAGIWGVMVLDATDLVALPALALSLWCLRAADRSEPIPQAPRRPPQLAVVTLAALASMATSPPKMARVYPQWQFENPARFSEGAVEVEAWVSKSGKTGVGVTLALTNNAEQPVGVLVEQAVFSVGVLRASTASRQSTDIAPKTQAFIYLPLPFDNNAIWNDGERAGHLELRLIVGDGPAVEQRFRMNHMWVAPEHPLDDRGGLR